jgi:hypothetical protein
MMGRGARWIIVGGLCLLLAFAGKGQAATMSDGPTFLARYGVDASLAKPIKFVDHIPNRYDPALEARAAAGSENILVVRQADPRDQARDILHEDLHYASFWRWHGVDGQFVQDEQYNWRIVYKYDAQLTNEAWLLKYEEALVQAIARAMMPRWWKYLTGRRIDPEWEGLSTAYDAGVIQWNARAKKATGESWRTRAGREWLVAALTLPPPERQALYDSLT